MEEKFLEAVNSIRLDLSNLSKKLDGHGEKVSSLETQSARLTSHIDSELKTIAREFETLNKKIDKSSDSIFNTEKGLMIRIDRLEQEEIRRSGQIKWIWSILSSILVALILTFITSNFSVEFGQKNVKPPQTENPQ